METVRCYTSLWCVWVLGVQVQAARDEVVGRNTRRQTNLSRRKHVNSMITEQKKSWNIGEILPTFPSDRLLLVYSHLRMQLRSYFTALYLQKF